MQNSRLIVFNKPYGVICQFSQHKLHRSLKDFIPIENYYAAGRLDTDSEGLLILTNNGIIQNKITHPRYKLEKTYYAQLEGIAEQEKLMLLTKVIDLKEFKTQAAKIRLLTEAEIKSIWQRTPPIRFRKNVADFWLEIKISEGKNRQVRRMTAHVGYPCLRLIRVAIGSINLFDLQLPLGQWRWLDNAYLAN